MSDEQTFAMQGRAHAALKKSKSNAATIKTELLDLSRTLSEVSVLLRAFAENPTMKNSSGISPAEHMRDQIEGALSNRTLTLIDELVAETKKAEELQKQIDQF